MTLADRIVAMNAGLIQQIGSPRDLYERPANLFVAGFIGSPAMNLLPATYRAQDGGAFLEIDGHRLPVPPRPDVPDATAVTAGIRPEDIVLDVTSAEEGVVDGRVELVEPMGLGTIVHVAALGSAIKAFTLDRAEHPVGSAIWIRPVS
jgi:multiple sugar transport system ATP-binding protein